MSTMKGSYIWRKSDPAKPSIVCTEKGREMNSKFEAVSTTRETYKVHEVETPKADFTPLMPSKLHDNAVSLSSISTMQDHFRAHCIQSASSAPTKCSNQIDEGAASMKYAFQGTSTYHSAHCRKSCGKDTYVGKNRN